MHAKEGDASLLAVGVVILAEGTGVLYHVAMLVAHYLSVVVSLGQAALQGGVNPVEVPTGLLVAVAIRAVLHHLTSSDVAALVQLPEDGVAVGAVAHMVVHQHLGDASALHRVPLDVVAYPTHQL